MKIDAIKREIPEAISEDGGALVMIVNKNTVPLETSVKEAKEGLYVIGAEELILGQFQGLLKSMAAGVARDGHSRQLGDYLTMYAQPKGEVDLDQGWNPDVNKMQLKARLLNEMEIDITDWVFHDVTPGRVPFKLENASTGATDGVVDAGSAVHLNGDDLPREFRVEWSCEDKGGEVAAEKVSGDATRINLAADVLDELKDVRYNGKSIVFTVRGNKAKASVKATVQYAVAPIVTPTIEAMFSPGYESEGKVAKNARTINIDGEGFSGLTKDDIAFELNGEALTLPQTAIWTINDDWIEIDNGTTAMFTGTDGDMIKVTLSKSGCTDVEFTTTLG